jgi:predicted nucleotide-binding protein
LTLFLERVGLDPVVFDEQPTGGRSVIEQLEHLAGAVSYAIVVLTPDDFGGSGALPTQTRPRARQNVIFELGYFAAKLGRGHVCALIRGDVEIPSDYQGVLYVAMDQNDAWHLKVAQETSAAGLIVDVTKLQSQPAASI